MMLPSRRRQHGHRYRFFDQRRLAWALQRRLRVLDPRLWGGNPRAGVAAACVRRDLVGLAIVVLVGGFTGWHAWRIVDSDFTVLEARLLVDRWTGEDRAWSVGNWFRAHDANAAALLITPDNPDLHDQLGLLFLMAARDSASRPEQRQRLFELAAAHQLASLKLRPFHGVGWAALAESMQEISPGSAETWQAWRNARRYAELEFPVQFGLVRVGFMGWQQAPDDVKAWLRKTYVAAERQRPGIDELAEQYGVADWRHEVARLIPPER